MPMVKSCTAGGGKLTEGFGALVEVDYPVAEPLRRQLVHLALRRERLYRRGDVEIYRVVIAERERVILRDERLHGLHAVADAVAAAGGGSAAEGENKQYAYNSFFIVFIAFMSALWGQCRGV